MCDRRSFAYRLQHHLLRRERAQRLHRSASGGALLRQPWRSLPARTDRQRCVLQVPNVQAIMPAPATQAPAHQAIHAAHQRESGALHSDRPARSGLRPTLQTLRPARGPFALLVASLQLAQTARRIEISTADQPTADYEQPGGFTHLCRKLWAPSTRTKKNHRRHRK